MSYLKSRLFLNYALSYLLILLVPLLLFAGAISQSATGNLQREVERAHYNQLAQARHTVDSRMRELDDRHPHRLRYPADQLPDP